MKRDVRAWLACEVLPGLFSNERFVIVRPEPNGREATLFVDDSLVREDATPERGRSVPGSIKVYVCDDSREKVSVLLPAQSPELGIFVSVPRALLSPA
jgi:hypothetical protein